jgi:hypothetical protein
MRRWGIFLGLLSLWTGPVQAQEHQRITVTRWVDPDHRKPTSFREWRAKFGEPKPLSLKRVYESQALWNQDDSRLVNLLINDGIYPYLTDLLTEYIQDLEGWRYGVAVDRVQGGSPEEIRAHLQAQLPSGLVGAVFLGSLPVPWYQMVDDWDNSGTRNDPLDLYEEFPCDLFYMDLDGTWLDTLQRYGTWDSLVPGSDGSYDTHTGAITPEIWVGRLDASRLSYEPELALYEKYLTRAHRYRRGEIILNDSALSYVDNDWYWDFAEVGLDSIYSEVVVINDTLATNGPDYKDRLDDCYSWVNIFCHSSPSYHVFDGHSPRPPTYVSNRDIYELKPQACFYNLFACSNVRFVEPDYMGGWYIFVDSCGLGAVGSTKTGSMWRFEQFHHPLGRGENLGEAFKEWFHYWMGDGVSNLERSWWYGMVLTGDPSLVARDLPPAPPQGLAASFADSAVRLSWTSNLEPDLRAYRVYRGFNIGAYTDTLGPVLRPETTFTDTSVILDTVYHYALSAVDFRGQEGELSSEVAIRTTGIEEPMTAGIFRFNEAFPNPFILKTKLNFTLLHPAQVSLKLYDAGGRLVRALLASEHLSPGLHHIAWDGRDGNHHRLPPGVYFYRLEAPGSPGLSGKVILLSSPY